MPLCHFPMVLEKPEEVRDGYKVITSARVAGLEYGQVYREDGVDFKLALHEIDLV